MGNSTSLERKKLVKVDRKGKICAKNDGNKLRMYLCCVVVLLGSTSVGTMLGLSSPLIPDIQKDTSKLAPHLTVSEASWFGALVTLGGMVGGILAGFIMQGIGRRMTSIISAIPYIIGLLFIALATKVWMLYLGRIITGLGVGISSLVVPVYIGEISTAELRGMLGSGAQLCIVTGILIIYGLGTCLTWRELSGAAAVIPFLLLVLSTYIPETPRFLMMKKKTDEARVVLQKLRGPSANIEEEFRSLVKSLSEESKSASWIEILREEGMRTPTLLSLAAMYFQQISGINCVMFYAKTLFMDAGFNSHSQLTLALLSIAGTQVLFTLISCIIIDKTGRKLVIIIGAVFMTLSLLAFGTYFQLQNAHSTFVNEMALVQFEMFNTSSGVPVFSANHHVPSLTWLALISMVVFIAAYSIGIGPVAWLLIGEIIPVRARGNSAGLATGFNLFLVFILTLQFSNMMDAMTPQGTFWFFAANCALSILFMVVFMPETKGKSLEEIEAYFKSK